MSDNVTANLGIGGPVFKTDEVGGVHTPISKVAFGVDGTVTVVDETNPLPVSVDFPSSQTVNGSVSVSNFPASQPVTGTFWQAIQPISGTVTANTGLSQPLTDAQLRASAVPVSGTVTANTGLSQPLTDTQLRATAVPVSGSFYPATQPVSASSLPLPSGAATSAKQDSIITTLGSPLQSGGSVSVSNLPSDPATDATLNNLLVSSISQGGIFFQLIRLLKKIALPSWFDPSLNRVRETAVIESGTVTTVTTVTTVSNQTNIGGYTAEQLIRMQTRSAWAAGQRSTLT